MNINEQWTPWPYAYRSKLPKAPSQLYPVPCIDLPGRSNQIEPKESRYIKIKIESKVTKEYKRLKVKEISDKICSIRAKKRETIKVTSKKGSVPTRSQRKKQMTSFRLQILAEHRQHRHRHWARDWGPWAQESIVDSNTITAIPFHFSAWSLPTSPMSFSRWLLNPKQANLRCLKHLKTIISILAILRRFPWIRGRCFCLLPCRISA